MKVQIMFNVQSPQEYLYLEVQPLCTARILSTTNQRISVNKPLAVLQLAKVVPTTKMETVGVATTANGKVAVDLIQLTVQQ